MKLKRRHSKRGRVEIIPLIDTILILLIFYMSFSSFNKTEKRIDAKMPSLRPADSEKPPSEVDLDLVMHVRNSNEIIIGGSIFTTSSLRMQMKSLEGQKVTVVIEAEPETKYQDVIGALDACAMAKLTKVAFRPIRAADAAAGGAAPAASP